MKNTTDVDCSIILLWYKMVLFIILWMPIARASPTVGPGGQDSFFKPQGANPQEF